jgi:hypothetical protein
MGGAGGAPLLLFAAFVIWAGVSLAWSPKPEYRALLLFAGAIGFFLLVVGAGLPRPTDLALARRAAMAALVAMTVLLLFETLFEFPIGRTMDAGVEGGASLEWTRRAVSFAALWFWGVAAILAPYRWPGWITIAALAAALVWVGVRLPYEPAAIALAVGFLPALLAFRWPRAAVATTAMAITALIVAAPAIMPTAAALGAQAWSDHTGTAPAYPWLARLDTWSYVTGQIRDHLAFGWGLGSAGSFTDSHTLAGFSTPYVPGHPQNASMHIWLETGAVGALLAAGALASFGRRAGVALVSDRWAAAAASGTMATAFILASVDWSAWAPYWWAGVAIAAALVRIARTAP